MRLSKTSKLNIIAADTIIFQKDAFCKNVGYFIACYLGFNVSYVHLTNGDIFVAENSIIAIKEIKKIRKNIPSLIIEE